jgi:hypothetical protein
MEVGLSIGRGKLVMPFPIAIRGICCTKLAFQTMLHVALLLQCSHSTLDCIYSLVAFERFFFPSSTMLVKTCNSNSSSSICFSTPFSSSIYLENESFNSSRTFWHDPKLIVEDVFASLCLTFRCNGNNFYCRGLRHVFCLTLKIVCLSIKLLVKAWTLHSSSTT